MGFVDRHPAHQSRERGLSEKRCHVLLKQHLRCHDPHADVVSLGEFFEQITSRESCITDRVLIDCERAQTATRRDFGLEKRVLATLIPCNTLGTHLLLHQDLCGHNEQRDAFFSPRIGGNGPCH
jgi:hypothetical protein